MEDEDLIENNRKIYENEARLSFSFERRQRHNSVDGRWYGPGPEALPPGPECPCWGCWARFRSPSHLKG